MVCGVWGLGDEGPPTMRVIGGEANGEDGEVEGEVMT